MTSSNVTTEKVCELHPIPSDSVRPDMYTHIYHPVPKHEPTHTMKPHSGDQASRMKLTLWFTGRVVSQMS